MKLAALAYAGRLTTVEAVCFEALLIAMFTALAAWTWRMIRKSFGALPALLWLTLCGIFLICAAMIGVLDFIHR
ncbi:MAG: hypothetical protein WA609_05860 [Terriglobales bacterium]